MTCPDFSGAWLYRCYKALLRRTVRRFPHCCANTVWLNTAKKRCRFFKKDRLYQPVFFLINLILTKAFM